MNEGQGDTLIVSFNGHTPQLHPRAWAAPGATLIGAVRLAEDANIWFGAVLRSDLHPITIGRGSNVQDNSVLHVGYHEPCVIGEWVTIGHHAVVHGCQVEDGCLIANHATVLDRVVVGAGAVIAAGAVVLEGVQIPPMTLWAGVPARQIRELDGDPPGIALARDYVKLVDYYRRTATVLDAQAVRDSQAQQAGE